VTRTVRSIPTEILLTDEEGLNVECAASFDNLQRIRLWGVTGARVLRSAKVAVDGHRPSRWLRGPGA
jgi:hypothetical protein